MHPQLKQQLVLEAVTGLAFSEPWLNLSTKPFDYSAAFSKQARSGVTERCRARRNVGPALRTRRRAQAS